MPTVGLDGDRFHYAESGTGEPVLLVHGTAVHPGVLDAVALRVASSRRVISYHRRGFLEGTTLALPSTDEYLRRSADDAARLLRELGAPRAAIVGWGYGAVIALALAVHHPSSVSRVIAYEAPLHVREHLGLRLTGAAVGAFGLGKVGLHKRGAERVLRRLFAYEDGGSAFDELEASVQKAMLAGSRSVLAETKAGGGEELTRAELSSIAAPVDLVVGTRSARFLRQAVDRQKELFPRARVVRIVNGDHALPIRDPARLAAAISELLA